MIVKLKSNAFVVLGIWALLSSLIAGYLSVSLEKRYLNNHPYFFDAVSYSFYNAKLYQRIQEVGQGTVLQEELSNNNRHPLRTLPLVMLAPLLLAHPFGHMATALPALFVFIFLIAYTIYKEARQFLPAIAGSFTAILLPGLYNPVSGIAAYWLDLTAAFLVGSAALALLNSNCARDLRWLAFYAVLGSLAAFARYVSVAYLLFATMPVLLWFLFNEVRVKHNWLRSVILPVIVVAGVSLILAGPFLFAHLRSVSEFYSVYGYAVGVPLKISSVAALVSLKEFIGPAGFLAIMIVSCTWLYISKSNGRIDASALLVRVWLFFSIPIFLIIIIKTSAIHTISYAVILMLVALVIPRFSSVSGNGGGGIPSWANLIVLLVMAAGWVGYYTSAWKQSANPSSDAAETKALQTKIADLVAGYGKKVVWNAYFDEWSWIPSLDSFYRHKVLPLPLGQDYVFSIHESVYRGNFPGWSEQKIYAALEKNANEWVNIAVVFDNPDASQHILPNLISQGAARHISEFVKNSPNWKKVFEIHTAKYGLLAGYFNSNARLDNYDLVCLLPPAEMKIMLGAFPK
jgi:hypothetical protein